MRRCCCSPEVGIVPKRCMGARLAVHLGAMAYMTRTESIVRRRMPVVIVLVLGAVGGCAGDKPGLFPPTPREAALGAFNIYDPDLRCSSVNLLAAAPFGGEPEYVRVYGLLVDDADPTVRAACAAALGLHGGVANVGKLLERLGDPVAFVRWEAAKALQKIHSREAITPLLAAMAEDEDADVRMAAAVALGQYAERRVFSALVAALEDSHYSVVAAAQRSLETLTGYDFGSDSQMWWAWAEETGDLFAHQKRYAWQPYEKPVGMMQKVKFWKKKPAPVLPRSPTGLNDG